MKQVFVGGDTATDTQLREEVAQLEFNNLKLIFPTRGKVLTEAIYEDMYTMMTSDVIVIISNSDPVSAWEGRLLQRLSKLAVKQFVSTADARRYLIGLDRNTTTK